jgi:hypothetical protein
MVASIRESAESMVVEGVRPLYRSPFYNTRTRASFDVDPKDGQRFYWEPRAGHELAGPQRHHQLGAAELAKK